MDRDKELEKLMREQLKDMALGSRQWRERNVVMSLDSKSRNAEDGETLGNFVDQDGRFVLGGPTT